MTIEEMSAQAAFAAHLSHATGQPVLMPDSWQMQSESAREDWKAAAAAAIETARAVAAGDIDGPVIIVTEAPAGDRPPVERHYGAVQWEWDDSGSALRLMRKGRMIASYGPGTWLSVREDDAEIHPAAVRALGIAKRALEKIDRRADDGTQPFTRSTIGEIASDAIAAIRAEAGA